MIIEFHTIHDKVSEQLINHIREELITLSHINKQIARAEVKLKEVPALIPAKNKKCEITLSIFGDELFAQWIGNSFQKSADIVLKELKKLVTQQMKDKNEPPDVIISTVEV